MIKPSYKNRVTSHMIIEGFSISHFTVQLCSTAYSFLFNSWEISVRCCGFYFSYRFGNCSYV